MIQQSYFWVLVKRIEIRIPKIYLHCYAIHESQEMGK